MENVNNQKNICLILPDIHNQHERAEKVISSVGPDKTFFLGDYFDEFYDNANDVQKTAHWLKNSLQKPNRIHLMGNHDSAYRFRSRVTSCSGFTDIKSMAINNIMKFSDWNKIKWHAILDGWLLVHAGLHPSWIPNGFVMTLKNIDEWLSKESEVANKMAARNESHWLFGAGFARGGSRPFGGLNWLDWNEEFTPIKGINQIVGHTPNRAPTWKYTTQDDVRIKTAPHVVPKFRADVSYNLCLDSFTKVGWYAIWDGEKLNVESYLNT